MDLMMRIITVPNVDLMMRIITTNKTILYQSRWLL